MPILKTNRLSVDVGKTLRRSLVAFALGLAALCVSMASQAADNSMDVSALLRRPGVKLVAVEFYADWCKPCKEAVPKWRALHDKYRAKGLYLVVVSVGEQGGCSSPGWNPDLTVCDLDASIQKRLSANPLPQAFIWSWQGHLLVSHAPVEQVEAAIERYFAETPRILVSDARDENGAPAKGGAALREQVRTELRKLAKFDLVVSEQESKTLSVLRQKSNSAAYDEAVACEVGSRVSANSELKIKVLNIGSGRQKLLLQLYSVEQGCMKATGDATIQDSDSEAAVFTAVSSLVEQLIGKTNEVPLPNKATSAPMKQSGPQISGGDWVQSTSSNPSVKKGAVTAALAQLSIKVVTPPDATITVTGPSKFADSGSGKWQRDDLVPGDYKVKMEAAGYETQNKTFNLEPDDVKGDKFTLLRLGILEITGTPEKAKVDISGPGGFSITRGLPLKITDASSGNYLIKISMGGYEPESYSAIAEPGKITRLPITLRKPGTLEIIGEPTGSKVEISGPNNFSDSGGLPLTIEGAWRGSYKVKVSRDGYESFEEWHVVKPEEIKRVVIKLEKTKEKIPPLSYYDSDSPSQRNSAYKGTSFPAIPSFQHEESNGTTWKDPKSGLTWQVVPADKRMNWNGAKAYCSSLSGGWHLPTKDELSSLIRKDAQGCKWPSEMKGKCDDWYWSSSSAEDNGLFAWLVIFNGGGVESSSFKTFDGYGRCVRLDNYSNSSIPPQGSQQPVTEGKSGAQFMLRFQVGLGFGMYKSTGKIPVNHNGMTHYIDKANGKSFGMDIPFMLGAKLGSGMTIGALFAFYMSKDSKTKVSDSTKKGSYLLNGRFGFEIGLLASNGLFFSSSSGLAANWLSVDFPGTPISTDPNSTSNESETTKTFLGPYGNITFGKEWGNGSTRHGIALASTYSYTKKYGVAIHSFSEMVCYSLAFYN